MNTQLLVINAYASLVEGVVTLVGKRQYGVKGKFLESLNSYERDQYEGPAVRFQVQGRYAIPLGGESELSLEPIRPQLRDQFTALRQFKTKPSVKKDGMKEWWSPDKAIRLVTNEGFVTVKCCIEEMANEAGEIVQANKLLINNFVSSRVTIPTDSTPCNF